MKVLSTLLLIAMPALADCNTDSMDSKRFFACLEQQLDDAQRELTSWENSIQFKLEEHQKTTGRTDALLNYQKTRQSYQTYIEQDCRWQFQVKLPDQKAAATAFKRCQTDHYQKRIELLKKADAQLPTP